MIGARGDYPESGAASDDLAGLIHLSNGPIEHDAWLPSVETGFQLVGSRLSTNRKQINECRPQVTVGRAFQPVGNRPSTNGERGNQSASSRQLLGGLVLWCPSSAKAVGNVRLVCQAGRVLRPPPFRPVS